MTDKSKNLLAILLVALIYVVWYLVPSGDAPLIDFAPLYVVGRMFLKGSWECFYDFLIIEHPWGYSIKTGDCFYQYGLLSNVSLGQYTIPLYLYSPSFIPFLAPISLIPWRIVTHLVFAINSAAFALAIYLCVSACFDGRERRIFFIIIALLLVTGEPTKWLIESGQVTVWLFLLTFSAWRLGERGHETKAGIALALAFWLKFFPGLLVLYWLRNHRMKAITVFAIAAIVWFLAGLAVFGIDIHREYWLSLKAMGTGVPIFPVNQSVESVLMRWVVPIQKSASAYNFAITTNVKIISMLIKLVFLLGLAALLIRPVLDDRRRRLQAYGIIALCSILLSVSWNHYAIFALPLTVYLLAFAWNKRKTGSEKWRVGAILGIAGIFFVIVYQYLNVRAVEWLTNQCIRIAGRDFAEPFAKILLARHIMGTVIFFYAGVVLFWKSGEKPEITEGAP